MPVYKREYTSRETRKSVWRFVFWHRQRCYAKSGFLREQDALDAERDLRQLVIRNEVTKIPNRKVTVKDFMPKFLEHRKRTKAENTAEHEERRAKPILASIGNLRLSEVTEGDVLEHVARRKDDDGLSNRSINLELTMLRSFFKYAKMMRMVLRNPAKEVTTLTEVQDEKWIPTREEFVRFVEAARATRFGAYIEPWLWFRAYTGTRPSESFHVEWSDIDFERNLVHIRPKNGHRLKNSKFRVVDMHPDLRPVLEQWRIEWLRLNQQRRERYPDSKDHNWVFMHPHNHDERGQGFLRTFDQARKAAGLPRMTSHTLRHYFISQCVMAGIELFTIARWVGHRNTKMIEEVYGHLAPDFKAAQMRKLNILPKDKKKKPATASVRAKDAPDVQDAAVDAPEEEERAAAVPDLAGNLAGAKTGKIITFVSR
jgi:integrase